MPSGKLVTQIVVELKYRDVAGSSTSTVYLDNGAGLFGLSSHPILKSISGLSARMGAYSPQSSGGSLVIDNTPGSFGYERRFSDLLERVTILDQELKVYLEMVEPGATTNYSANQIFSGTVRNWRVTGDSLTINFDGRGIRRQVMTRVINSDDYPNAPISSLGKALPIVIGGPVEVKPVMLTAAGDASPEYAYATTLHDDFVPGGVSTYYVKDAGGIYRSVASAANFTSGVIRVAQGTNTRTDIDEFANLISLGSGGVITGGQVRCAGSGNGAWRGGDGMLELNLYEKDERGLPGELIAKATRAKVDYQTSFRGASSARFWVEFTFDRPVVMGVGAYSDFFVSIADATADNWATDDPAWIAVNDTDVVPYYYNFISSSAKRVWKKGASGADFQIIFDLFGVKFTDTTTPSTFDADGLGVAYFEATQKAALSGIDNPDISTLDYVVAVDGLKDVTGAIESAGNVLKRPTSVTNMLGRAYSSGSGYLTTTVYDTAKYSSSHAPLSTTTDRYHRQLSGATEGRTTVAQLIEAIGRNTGCRTALVNSTTAGKYLGLWAWSYNEPSAATISDEDARVIEIEHRDAATVINNAQVFFNRQLRDLGVESGSAEGQFRNYARTATTFSGKNSVSTTLCSASVTNYGQRYNGNPNYDLILAQQSGQFVAEYLCALFGRPHIYATIEVPLEPYRALDLLNVVTIVHPDLPAYFGTSSNPRAVTYSGSDVDIWRGAYDKRARSWRAQIESREIQVPESGPPLLRLQCRLLNNYPNDPT